MGRAFQAHAHAHQSDYQFPDYCDEFRVSILHPASTTVFRHGDASTNKNRTFLQHDPAIMSSMRLGRQGDGVKKFLAR